MPIFIVAAAADINLRRISQLNKNVCYGCYTKNGRLLHVCYNVCYSCYKKGPQMLRATSTHQLVSELRGPPQLDLQLGGNSPFGCSARVLPLIYVCRPSGLHRARRWHISSAVTPPKSNLYRNPQSLALWCRFHTRGIVLPNQTISINGTS